MTQNIGGKMSKQNESQEDVIKRRCVKSDWKKNMIVE